MASFNKKMRFVLGLYFSLFFLEANAQFTAGSRLFVLNEGSFGRKGTIGQIDYDTNTYQHIDSIAAYGNQLLLNNNDLYVVNGAEEGNVIKYEVTTGGKQVITPNIGARGIAIDGQTLLVCGTIAPYFRVYDLATNTEIYHLDTTQVRSAREEVEVLHGKAYLSGYYGDTIITVVDLNTKTVIKNIETSENPYQIEQVGNTILVGCFTYNPDFTTNTTVHTIDAVSDNIVATTFIPKADGFTADANRLYLKKSNGKLLTYQVDNQSIDTINIQTNYYGLQYSKSANLLFYSETDFVSTGNVGYIEVPSMLIHAPLHTDISPRCFAFQVGTTSLNEPTSKNTYTIYPNPATDNLTIKAEGNADILLQDLQGRTLHKQTIANSTILDITQYLRGLYLLQIQQAGKTMIQKIEIQ